MDSLPPASDSQLVLRSSAVELSTSASEKAWHLLALLLSHGRPADPAELASKCKLFDSDPDFIRFLCSIPNSPIRLAQDCVTFSQTGLAAVAQFFASFEVVVKALDSPPRFEPKLLENGRAGSIKKIYIRKKRKRLADEDEVSVNKRCSIRAICDEKKQDTKLVVSPDVIQNIYDGVLAGYTSGRYKSNSSYSSVLEIDSPKLERTICLPPMSVSPTLQLRDHQLQIVDYGFDVMEDNLLRSHFCQARCQFDTLSRDIYSYLHGALPEEKHTESAFHSELSILHCTSNSEVGKDDKVDVVNSVTDLNHGTSSCLSAEKNVAILQPSNETTGQACGSLAGDMNGEINDVFLHDLKRSDVKDLAMDGSIVDKYTVGKAGKFSSIAKLMDEVRPENCHQSEGGFLKCEVQSSALEVEIKNLALHEKNDKALKNCIRVDPQPELEQCKKNQESNPIKHRTKWNYEQDINTRGKNETTMENKKGIPSASEKIEIDNRTLPDFEGFCVEKEEGSGGYGTVYRARRKSDGIVFAIKCPHVKANKIHVLNELKMLQRLGGKNYIIKYEGSFKSGDSDCLVLEHVKHDRPEVLKREIDIFQLRWYGYCMFRALAGLHKLGIVHRDIKPGNFLFSRTVKRGFLIDFNLALDLHKKQGSSGGNPGAGCDLKIRQPSLSQTKSPPPAKDRKPMKTRLSEAINNNAEKSSRSLFPPGISKKKVNQAKVYTESGNRNINKSQGADGSGITSAKDATSTRTPSAERLRQPMPCTIRRELRSWAQEALEGGRSNEHVNAPTSKRKRVAAPVQATDRRHFCPTPMPLHANGVAIPGAGLLKSNGKHRREGPCVGTKGFRAPEVLFKSGHQGPKMDVWSAGVTLLYLMIGRTPFTGEPEQNIKEIAKLRGSEDLWEVAKLHNQESQFPPELFDVKHFSPVNLRDWCAQNTRRPDLAIPRSLFDLVDKCLTVNPRTRLSAEDALRHEFFAPCLESLRKQKLQRQAANSESGTTHILPGESQTCEVN